MLVPSKIDSDTVIVPATGPGTLGFSTTYTEHASPGDTGRPSLHVPRVTVKSGFDDTTTDGRNVDGPSLRTQKYHSSLGRFTPTVPRSSAGDTSCADRCTDTTCRPPASAPVNRSAARVSNTTTWPDPLRSGWALLAGAGVRPSASSDTRRTTPRSTSLTTMSPSPPSGPAADSMMNRLRARVTNATWLPSSTTPPHRCA